MGFDLDREGVKLGQKWGRIKPNGIGCWSISLEQKASVKGYCKSGLVRGKGEKNDLW